MTFRRFPSQGQNGSRPVGKNSRNIREFFPDSSLYPSPRLLEQPTSSPGCGHRSVTPGARSPAHEHRKQGEGAQNNENQNCRGIARGRLLGLVRASPASRTQGEPCSPAGDAHRGDCGHDAGARHWHSNQRGAGQCPDHHRQRDAKAGVGQRARLPRPQHRQRERQRGAGQPVPARRELPRVHGIAAVGCTAGLVGVPGRGARKRSVRRRGELGSDSARRHFHHDPHPGIQPGVRSEHAGRRAVGEHEERPRSIRAAR